MDGTGGNGHGGTSKTLYCPAGEIAVGGGYALNGPEADEGIFTVRYSLPQQDATLGWGWNVWVTTIPGYTPGNFPNDELGISVVCAPQ
jgi:hypothetical protein